MPKDTAKPRTRMPRLRRPTATDGADIWALVKTCKPLDENSMYCNLVQAEHFRDTCVVASRCDAWPGCRYGGRPSASSGRESMARISGLRLQAPGIRWLKQVPTPRVPAIRTA